MKNIKKCDVYSINLPDVHVFNVAN